MQIETDRIRLRSWAETDRDAFAKLCEDPIVMADLGGPLDRNDSDAKFDRYAEAFQRNGYGRWLLETLSGEFLGYCGVMPVCGDHPIGRHDEIGWRLHRHAWGNGYATEAARTALRDAFLRVQLQEIFAYTAADNLRSQVEGAIIMGLGPVLREEMRFENGRMLNASFAEYQTPRLKDMPELDIHLLNRPDLASAGGGETPIIAVAPAIGNAICHATGVRLRDLPMRFPETKGS